MERAVSESPSRGRFDVASWLLAMVLGLALGAIAILLGALYFWRPHRYPSWVVVEAEIKQLEMALQVYRSECGEYPPDFTNEDDVRRHLRQAFPRYGPPNGEGDVYAQFVEDLRQNYGLDATKFDPASALVFWLGGLPETPREAPSGLWVPAGFHADPANPFQPGLPRRFPIFAFDAEHLQVRDPDDPARQLRYYSKVRSADSLMGPFVYFRARYIPELERYEYGVAATLGDSNTSIEPLQYQHAADNIAVPYLRWDPGDPNPTAMTEEQLRGAHCARKWRSHDTFQIIHPGPDGRFGNGGPFRYTLSGYLFSSDGGDYDNFCSFSRGRLEDEIE